MILAGGAYPALADNGPHVSTAFGTNSGSPDSGVVATQTTGNLISTTNGVATDRCAGCHRAHTALGEGLLNITAGATLPAATALCITCHGPSGTGATTDVMDGLGYTTGRDITTASALRAGGFSFAQLGGATVDTSTTLSPYSMTANLVTDTKTIGVLSPFVTTGTTTGATTSAHSIDGTNQTAWGGGNPGSGAGSTVALECVSCHDPHGNGNYRILRPIPDGAPAGTSPVRISDVPGGATGTHTYTTTNYWLVDATEFPLSTTATFSHGFPGSAATTPFLSNISSWCATCHTRILSPTEGYGTALQTASPDVLSGSLVNGNSTKTGYLLSGYLSTPSPLTVGQWVMFTGIKVSGNLSPYTPYYVTAAGTSGSLNWAQLSTDAVSAALVIANQLTPVPVSTVLNPATITPTVPATPGPAAAAVLTVPAGATLPSTTVPIVMTYVKGVLGLKTYWPYYAVAVSGNSFSLSLTQGGTPIAINAATGATTMVAAWALSTGEDSMFTFRHRSDAGYVSFSPGTTTGDRYANNPNCITCHVAHGSNVAVSGFANSIAMPGTTTPATHDSFLLRVENRGICKMCHNV